MLDRNKLNEFSTAFAHRLLLVFPLWEQFAKNLDGGVFEVKVPHVGTNRHLLISTQDNELTVGYDLWHSHWGSFLGLSNAEAIEQVMEEIQAIVDEDQLIFISFCDGKWARSSDWPACMPVVTEPGGTTFVYSWRGTHDRVLDGIPKLLDAGF